MWNQLLANLEARIIEAEEDGDGPVFFEMEIGDACEVRDMIRTRAAHEQLDHVKQQLSQTR